MKLSVDRMPLEMPGSNRANLEGSTRSSHNDIPSSVRSPLAVDNVDGIARLRQVLQTNGYPGRSVRDVLGREIGSAHLRLDLPLYLRRLATPSPLNTLVKLFALGVEVSEAEARTALVPLGLEEATALGLIECDDSRVRPLVSIAICDDLFLVHDSLNEDTSALRSDYVLGVNPAAVALANLTLRRPAGSVLDLGTGCGIQALLAASHSARVIGVDTNARALHIAQFNARLNGVSNAEFRLGSLFEPVAGERFDLIVSNPPYVISPETKYMFRDSGLPGDTICEAVIRQAHQYLNQGGFACVLCNWALKPGERWDAPLRRWVKGNGCDAWLIHTSTQDPLTYAAIWTRDRDAKVYEDALDRWVQYYEQNGIDTIGLGAVVLRRRSAGHNWLRTDEFSTSPSSSCSDLIRSVFATEDYLGSLPDGHAILRERFLRTGNHRVRQTFLQNNGHLDLERVELHWQRGFQFQGEIDARTLELLSRCDGKHSIGEIIAQWNTGGKAAPVDHAAVGSKIVGRLLALGLLAPVR